MPIELLPIELFLVQVAVKDTRGSKSEDEPPPMWFRSYMEKVRWFSLSFDLKKHPHFSPADTLQTLTVQR